MNYYPIQVGQTTESKQETFATALRQVTPTLLIVGIATGFAIAIGTAIAERFITPRIRRR